ncbi:hypothetical protein SADUNF_Sadunf08G0043000 [Salix dunnii]|uniref:3-oxo-5-alpha-steroid 4-dehydrogenase C-terminal domain-containing protein n=1 Tax=Salix dunnii TaxID=1413687 RepID=A0A835MX94_9ROSI|nr:hypothetical protein SADUNF_Sadunf08G0043000 [Salix dunnii]
MKLDLNFEFFVDEFQIHVCFHLYTSPDFFYPSPKEPYVNRRVVYVVKASDAIFVSITVSACLTLTAKKFYPARQRLTLPLPSGSKERPTVLNYKKNLKEYHDGNLDSVTILFKDLGPQVSYRTLFFFEYLGPLVLYPLFYYFPVYQFLGYEGEHIMHPVQTYALYYWCFHYFKRIMETFFVHRFSHATSPLSNVFRNCAYYWTFGSYIAYYVNHPLYTPVSDLQMKIGFGFGLVCQLANFYCHILLRSLRRPDGNGGYQIPSGFLFNIVTCANYTTEIYQWLGFNIATQTVAGYIFLVVATSIMTNWALAKHRRLKKESHVSVSSRKLSSHSHSIARGSETFNSRQDTAVYNVRFDLPRGSYVMIHKRSARNRQRVKEKGSELWKRTPTVMCWKG